MNAPTPLKDVSPHSSRVGLDRQEVLPKGQDVLPMLSGAEGLERFKGHVQIGEDDDANGWDRQIPSATVPVCFFPVFQTDFRHNTQRIYGDLASAPKGEKPKAAAI
ncbi:hypothetical protein EOD23_11850 [Mesorhizobium sp. USDA-HM6]|nr:hypothetical protein EOD23_11850 [Mesorhizobium sp. USDA-HM6]